MKRVNPQEMLQSFLFNSQYKKLLRLKNISAYPLNIHQNYSDQAYLDNFISNIHCEFLLSGEYQHKQTTRLTLANNLAALQASAKSNRQNSSATMGNIQEIQRKLIAYLQKLNRDRMCFLNYLQVQELVSTLDQQQALRYKKHLVNLYRWTLEQKGRLGPQYESVMTQLKVTLMNRIFKTFQKVEEKQNIQKQIKVEENLANARQSLAQGKDELAKEQYEKVFEDQTNDEKVRMEALEFLCKTSRQKGDEQYLMSMISKLKKQRGEEEHCRYVQKVLGELSTTAPKNNLRRHN